MIHANYLCNGRRTRIGHVIPRTSVRGVRKPKYRATIVRHARIMLVDHKEKPTAKKDKIKTWVTDQSKRQLQGDKIKTWVTDQKMGHEKTTFTYPKRQLQGDKIKTWWTGPSSSYSRTGRIKTRLAHFSGFAHSLTFSLLDATFVLVALRKRILIDIYSGWSEIKWRTVKLQSRIEEWSYCGSE